MTFFKKQHYGDKKRISGRQGLEGKEGGMYRQSKEDFRAIQLLCMSRERWVHIIIPLSTPIECRAPRMSPKVNSGLGPVVMCQCRLISCSQCTPQAGLLVVGRLRMCEAGNLWELWLPTQFFWDPHTALRKNVFFFSFFSKCLALWVDYPISSHQPHVAAKHLKVSSAKGELL